MEGFDQQVLADAAERALLVEAVVERNGLEKLEHILAIMQRHDAFEYSRQRAQQEVDKARQALQVLPDSPYREALLALADMAVARNS